MIYSFTHPKKYQLLLLPNPKTRGNSLKNSQAHLLSQLTNMTKRYSLDSKPPSNSQKHSSFIENAEEPLIPTKNLISKLNSGKGQKMMGEDNFRTKYYWRGKQSKQSKKENKGKVSKSRGMWSELGRHLNGKTKTKYLSRSK